MIRIAAMEFNFSARYCMIKVHQSTSTDEEGDIVGSELDASALKLAFRATRTLCRAANQITKPVCALGSCKTVDVVTKKKRRNNESDSEVGTRQRHAVFWQT